MLYALYVLNKSPGNNSALKLKPDMEVSHSLLSNPKPEGTNTMPKVMRKAAKEDLLNDDTNSANKPTEMHPISLINVETIIYCFIVMG